jgi:type I restriction enzyme M protein
MLEPTKDAVLKEKEKREAAGINPEPFLLKKSGLLFYNTSPLDTKKADGRSGQHRREHVLVHPSFLTGCAGHL